MNREEIIADGKTEDGYEVQVLWSEGEGFGNYECYINGFHVPTIRVTRIRDGGTTEVVVEGDFRIRFPHRIGNPDRVPKLNGKDIV